MTVTLRGSNPIVKVTTGTAIGVSYPYHHHVFKGFRAVCPDCGQVVRDQWGRNGSHTPTRKQAKDALYQHRKRRGTIFGCQAQPTPALEGE